MERIRARGWIGVALVATLSMMLLSLGSGFGRAEAQGGVAIAGAGMSQSVDTLGSSTSRFAMDPQPRGMSAAPLAAKATPTAVGGGTETGTTTSGANTTNRLPATGVGTPAWSGPAGGLALVAGMLCVLLGAAAWVVYRRA
jgi:hypothetical protein